MMKHLNQDILYKLENLQHNKFQIKNKIKIKNKIPQKILFNKIFKNLINSQQ